MNFLAHLYLSENTPEAMAGNLLADFIKGPDVQTLSAAIQAGIHHHRRVDAFTDRHPMVQRSISRVSAQWGWFSGILIDVYYDHILAVHWERYSPTPLRVFADHAYAAILSITDHVPEGVRMYAFRMIEADRLVRYRELSGVQEALYRLSLRIAERIPQRALPLDHALPDLLAATPALTEDFHAFFPTLCAHAGPHLAGRETLPVPEPAQPGRPE